MVKYYLKEKEIVMEWHSIRLLYNIRIQIKEKNYNKKTTKASYGHMLDLRT